MAALGDNVNIPPNAAFVIYTDINGQLLDTLPVCQDFNRSMCSRLNCRFVHLMESDKVEVCDQRVAVCRDHANGQCKRKQCKYYHIPIVLPPANVMATIYKAQHSLSGNCYEANTHSTTTTTTNLINNLSTSNCNHNYNKNNGSKAATTAALSSTLTPATLSSTITTSPKHLTVATNLSATPMSTASTLLNAVASTITNSAAVAPASNANLYINHVSNITNNMPSDELNILLNGRMLNNNSNGGNLISLTSATNNKSNFIAMSTPSAISIDGDGNDTNVSIDRAKMSQGTSMYLL